MFIPLKYNSFCPPSNKNQTRGKLSEKSEQVNLFISSDNHFYSIQFIDTASINIRRDVREVYKEGKFNYNLLFVLEKQRKFPKYNENLNL